jgi:hypothetical protein
MKECSKAYSLLMWLQGGYFFITGAWPLIHLKSFLFVTGPKTDLWLVETVGVLILSLSIGMLFAAYRKIISAQIIIPSMASALGLLLIDVIYVFKNVIRPIYLADAFIELVILFAWTILLLKKNN